MDGVGVRDSAPPPYAAPYGSWMADRCVDDGYGDQWYEGVGDGDTGANRAKMSGSTLLTISRFWALQCRTKSAGEARTAD